mgnify:FL=1
MKQLIFVFCFIILINLISEEAHGQNILPPVVVWSGNSEKLIVDSDNPWITPAEKDDFIFTPDYNATVSYLKTLSGASDLISLKEIGKSAQNRPILMVIASSEVEMHNGQNPIGLKPKIMIQAGIHAGEIDGKDAGLMLLRDIAFGGKSALLDKVNFIFIPILSVDAHENASPFNRPNQRGPENMGWRTNAKNLNLNRDYTKLETEGLQAAVSVMSTYKPIFFADIHVTDGADYQYDITYGFKKKNAYSKGIAQWLETNFQPEVNRGLSMEGHFPGPLIFSFKSDDFSNGIIDYYLPLRFSDAYGDARHIPSVLVENHSLKPYKQRVLGSYVFIENSIKTIAGKLDELLETIHNDRTLKRDSIPLSFGFSEIQKDSIALDIIQSRRDSSLITNQRYTTWTGEPKTVMVPHIKMDDPLEITKIPTAYWIPVEWTEVIEKLKLHGIQMEIVEQNVEKELAQYMINEYEIDPRPNEGHFRFKTLDLVQITRVMKLHPGSVRISTDQDLAVLISLLLEPKAPDSFFQWGYFNTILSRTEYIESYVMEPLISQMLKEDTDLRLRFEKMKRQDKKFADNPRKIMEWFYAKTPYFDKNWKLIPIGIEY